MLRAWFGFLPFQMTYLNIFGAIGINLPGLKQNPLTGPDFSPPIHPHPSPRGQVNYQ